eukprot:s1559_g14.t2
MVGTWMLWQNGWDLGGRYHGGAVWVDDIMVGTWMLWQDGWGLGGRYHGWDLDALAERMGSGWTISWLGPGCSGRSDGVWVDDIMVGTWMLWQNGCGLGGRYHGWDLDALAERMRSGWTISWLGPGCSGRTDGVWVDDIMIGTWMLWQFGWGLVPRAARKSDLGGRRDRGGKKGWANDQVANVSFVDLDLDESQLGGTIEWDPPLRTAAVSVPLSADLQKQFAQEDTVLASVLSIHLNIVLNEWAFPVCGMSRDGPA